MKKSKTRKITKKIRKITRNNKKAGTKKAVKPKGAHPAKITKEYIIEKREKKFGKNREDFINKALNTKVVEDV
tara:strand:- start:1270 stop:1488 length:219 start_codon:yes stop_codon:yes gene_type:complete